MQETPCSRSRMNAIESAQSHVQWNVDQSINGNFHFQVILEVLSKRNKRQPDFRCGGALTLCTKVCDDSEFRHFQFLSLFPSAVADG